VLAHHAEAPALVGLLPKSIYTPGEEDRAWDLAVRAAPGASSRPLPVWLGRKKLGYILHDRRGRVFTYHTAATGLNDIEAAFAAGQKWRTTFRKPNTAGAGSVDSLWYDMYPNQGDPGSLGTPYSGTALTARSFVDTMPSGIKHGPSVGSLIKKFSKLNCRLSSGGHGIVLLFYDRVIAYDNCLYSASLQNMTNTVTVPRYGSNGAGGLQIGCSSITGTGVGPVTLAALSYTNDQGSTASAPIQTNHVSVTPSRSAFLATYGAELVFPYCTNAAGTSGAWVELAAADLGVQKINSITWSAADGTNTYSLFLARELAISVLPASATQWEADQITGFMNYERIVDGAYICFMEWCTQGNAAVYGRLEFVWS
jgi:hypothetical protein